MNKKLILIVLLVIGLLGFSGKFDAGRMLGISSENIAVKNSITVVDTTDTTVSIKKAAKRVVTLTGADSELLLKLGKKPVGVVVSDSTPEFVKKDLEKIPNMGKVVGPSLELILDQKPDLIIGSGMSFQTKMRKSFSKEGIPAYFHVARSYDDVMKQILDIGELTGQEKEAKELVESYKNKLNEIKERHKNEPKERILIVFGTPVSYYLATSNTYVGDVFRLIGAKNEADEFLVIGDIKDDGNLEKAVDERSKEKRADDKVKSGEAAKVTNGFVALNVETMAQLNPDRVFIVMHGQGKNVEEKFKNAFKSSVWRNIPAIKNGNIEILPAELFSTIPTARIDKVLEYLEGALYE